MENLNPPEVSDNQIEKKNQQSCLGSLGAAFLGMLGFCYMLNLTFGMDLIPDNFPFVGNLDEGVATYLVISALAYFGIDIIPSRRK